MTNEEKWLRIALLHSKASRAYAKQGRIEDEIAAVARSVDAFDKMYAERRRLGIKKYITVC